MVERRLVQIWARLLMSERPLLAGLRDEIVQLAMLVVQANARVNVVEGKLRASSGSAWLYADRLWVTNHHVVAEARGKVTLTSSFRQLDGDVIGKDSDTDLAVIRLRESIGVEPLALRATPAKLGEICFAIGAPLGEYADTISMGIVSGLNRRLDDGGGKVIEDVLQTDAAINHGNSGGPLVDIDGRVLGVNTAGRDDANNIGFAIPALTVGDIVPELIESGAITRASIGARIEIRKSKNSPTADLVVLDTYDEHSHLQPGDVLRAFDGRPLKRRADLTRMLRRDVIDRDVALVIERSGMSQTISIRPKLRQ